MRRWRWRRNIEGRGDGSSKVASEPFEKHQKRSASVALQLAALADDDDDTATTISISTTKATTAVADCSSWDRFFFLLCEANDS